MQGLSPSSVSSNLQDGDYVQPPQSIGQLFRDYGEEYIRVFNPPLCTINLIRSIRICRTPYLGGYLYTCEGCGAERKQYLSCGNSQCPRKDYAFLAGAVSGDKTLAMAGSVSQPDVGRSVCACDLYITT